MLAVLVGVRLELDLVLLAERGADLKRVNAVQPNPIAEERLVGGEVGGSEAIYLDGRQYNLANLVLKFFSFHVCAVQCRYSAPVASDENVDIGVVSR